jgi:hypothetical protein
VVFQAVLHGLRRSPPGDSPQALWRILVEQETPQTLWSFAFVARQKRLQYEDEFFYVDLVFYNCILKCYLLIDLKIGELTHQDIGQVDSYVRMFDDKYITEGDNPTIGLILCAKKNETIARYSVLKDNKQLFASKYMLYLPTEEELQAELERERRMIKERRVDI